MSLDIKKEMDDIRRMYADDKTQNSFNLLLLGPTGYGKTYILRTCRRPIHIDSFDPGGTKHLIQGIKEGWILVDTRWEHDNPFKPYVIDEWKKTMDRRIKMGYFNAIGTYALDSMTMWGECIMNRQMKLAGLPGTPPRFTHDYTPAKTTIKNFLSDLLSLPCDFVMTGHLVPTKDEVDGSIEMQLVTIGNLDSYIPSQFEEIWIASAKDGASGPEYSILTSPKGRYRKVRTKIGASKFDQFEKPDVKYLLQKAGRPTADVKMEGGDNP